MPFISPHKEILCPYKSHFNKMRTLDTLSYFKIYVIKEWFIYSKRQILSNYKNLTDACNLVTTIQVEIQNISSSCEISLRPWLIQHPPHFNIVTILMILKLLIEVIIRYVFLCACLLLFSIMFLRFIKIYVSKLFLLLWLYFIT